MSFLNPTLLVALAAAAVPVIIHFINFRKPRKIAFSTLAFFQELQKSTIRRIQLKRYLLLAMRVLAVALLATALAGPFLPSQLTGWLGASSRGDHVAILVDNGPSMMQVDESGPFMDQVRSAVREIIAREGESARFLLVPSHGELASGRFMREAEALRFLERLEPVNKGGYPAERMQYLRERLDDEPGSSGHIYWISDARKTHLDKLENVFGEQRLDREQQPEQPAQPEQQQQQQKEQGQQARHPLTFVRLGSDSFRNVAVAGVEVAGKVSGTGIPVGIAVTVRNFGDQPVHNTYLSLEIDGERIGQYEVSLDAGQERELLFEVIPDSPGTIQGRAILEGGTYTFDHTRYFSLSVPQSRNVLLVGDHGEDGSRRSFLRPVMEAVGETGTRLNSTYTDISNLRDHDLDGYDAIILESIRQVPDYLQAELVQFVQRGRGLLFVPSEQGDIGNYNQFLAQFGAGAYAGMRGTYGRFEEVASFQPLDPGHVLVSGLFEAQEDEEVLIDMPAIFHYWRYNRQGAGSGSTILQSNLAEPLFVEHSFGEGMVMVGTMGFSPGWSNLSIKPLYAPLLYRMLLYVVSWEHGGAREHILGVPFDRYFTDYGGRVLMRLNGEQIHPETAAGARGLRVRYPAREWEPGWLKLEFNGKKTVMAINQDISESDFASLSITEAEEFLNRLLPVAGVIDISGQTDTQIRSAMATASFGREIWNWFIWFALAFMVAECIISKKYRTETADD